jgi:3-hydroxyacyl-CoA dehydrogenase / enoyl-CoA hydratase / 3-hydroxybutyryl-CoA epimerase
MTNIRVEKDADGIVTLTWDMPGRSMNVLSEDSISEYVVAADAAIADSTVKGVVVTSAKPAFVAGADLSMLQKQTGAASKPGAKPEERAKAVFDNLMQFNLAMRRIEKGGKPFVAAINGLALGGGLEVCLACHYRVVASDPRIQLGLVESKVGLMPGAGGTQRMPRLMGAMAALPMMLEGRTIGPDAALKGGLVHKVVPAPDLITEAKAYIKAGGKAVQPWDEKGFRVPGGDPYSTAGGQVFVAGNAMLHAKTMGNYPAPEAIMCAVYEGLLVPIDAGLRIEARYMTKVMMHPASRNMIRSLFVNMQKANKLERRPKDAPPTKLDKIGVLGAGMMGAGIAYVSALAGLDVVLIDRSQEEAEKGKGYSAKLLAKQVERGRLKQDAAEAILARIKPATSYDGLKDADFVIEAVFEERAIKADVTKRPLPYCRRACRSRPIRPPCRSAALPRRGATRRRSSACTSSRRSTRCSWSRSSAARRRRTPRSRWPWTTSSASRRRRSSSTTRGASIPAACSPPTPAKACACWPRASTRR